MFIGGPPPPSSSPPPAAPEGAPPLLTGAPHAMQTVPSRLDGRRSCNRGGSLASGNPCPLLLLLLPLLLLRLLLLVLLLVFLWLLLQCRHRLVRGAPSSGGGPSMRVPARGEASGAPPRRVGDGSSVAAAAAAALPPWVFLDFPESTRGDRVLERRRHAPRMPPR